MGGTRRSPAARSASTRVVFVLHFALEFIIAPRKLAYLRRNWLTAVSLMLPAFRVVRLARVMRVMRVARGVRLVRVVSSANRGMRTLGRVMGRRGLSYVIALTVLVNLLGAAGILAFEREAANGAIAGYGSTLWWTAMTLTTMGADYFRSRRRAVSSACCWRDMASRCSVT